MRRNCAIRHRLTRYRPSQSSPPLEASHAEICRSIDTAARHGVDEFAVVLPEAGVAAATLVARRICELLDADGEAPTLSVSLRIASNPREADTIGTLRYTADKALYAMKDHRQKAAPTLTARNGA